MIGSPSARRAEVERFEQAPRPRGVHGAGAQPARAPGPARVLHELAQPAGDVAWNLLAGFRRQAKVAFRDRQVGSEEGEDRARAIGAEQHLEASTASATVDRVAAA